VTTAVNRIGPKVAGTSVTLGAAQISPMSGEGTLDDLVVANPPGWSQGNAIAFKRIHVSVVPTSLFGDHVIIRDLEIDGPQFLYETKVVSSNIGELVRNIEGGQNNPEAEAKTNSGSTKRFEIDHFVVKNGKITLAVGNGPGVAIDMPAIDLHDLGRSENGISSGQMAAQVGGVLLNTVAKSAIAALGKLSKTGTGAASDLIRGVRGFFGH
jgi:hypothetical protein